jgi:hypothetical protein
VFVTRIGEPAESVVEIKEWDWTIQPTVVDSSSARNHISMRVIHGSENVQARQKPARRAMRTAPRSMVPGGACSPRLNQHISSG